MFLKYFHHPKIENIAFLSILWISNLCFVPGRFSLFTRVLKFTLLKTNNTFGISLIPLCPLYTIMKNWIANFKTCNFPIEDEDRSWRLVLSTLPPKYRCSLQVYICRSIVCDLSSVSKRCKHLQLCCND